MQAAHAFVAFLRSGSWTTSVLMASFMVSMPAIEVANWALLKSITMLKHLPAAACAPAGRPANGLEELADGPGAGLPGPDRSILKPYCRASAVPM
jgi:hypothetical protein